MYLLRLLPLCALVACKVGGNGSGDPVDAGEPDAPSASCLEAREHSDLDWIQDKILTPSCAAFNACHKGAAAAAAELNLEAGQSHEALVGVTSKTFPEYDLVVPNDPENSYLMIAIGHYDGPEPESGIMPPANPMLCVDKREAIERWIEAGAPAAGSEATAGVTDSPDDGPR